MAATAAVALLIGVPQTQATLLIAGQIGATTFRETPNKVGGGGGLATEAYLLTAACLEAVWVGANRGCSEVLLGRFRD